jgi:peptidyl-prolyl cis-trans isomerase C
MKRTLLVITLILASAVSAQQKPADPGQAIVAVVNGETITRAKLDALYSKLTAQMRAQYDRVGGKRAFLDNYVGKRLLVQEAIKSNFDDRTNVKAAIEAARESALFDSYVRDVIAAEIVTDADMRKHYESNAATYHTAETMKARHIIVLFKDKTREQAFEKITAALNEIRAGLKGKSPELTSSVFQQAAAKYSEDGTRTQGGDLGWLKKGANDARFEAAAAKLKVGEVSEPVESSFGLHLILIEGRRPASTAPFDSVRDDIRQTLMNEKMAEVMTAVQRITGELRRASKVAIYSENID